MDPLPLNLPGVHPEQFKFYEGCWNFLKTRPRPESPVPPQADVTVLRAGGDRLPHECDMGTSLLGAPFIESCCVTFECRGESVRVRTRDERLRPV